MKDALREPLIKRRKSLSLTDIDYKSQRIVENVRRTTEFKQAKRIAFYYAVNGEADPIRLKEFSTQKEFFLPILSQQNNQGLLFGPFKENTKFSNNQFSIPEPECKEDELITPDLLDLVIVPLLGFDRKGNRLGMGGGFYDRSFAFRIKQKTNPWLIGFAYDFQEVTDIEVEPWDVGLDMIATESEIINF